MTDTDHAMHIAGLIKQLRELYLRHNDTNSVARACPSLSDTCSGQAINRCRSALGEAVWNLSVSCREHSRQILAQAFMLVQDTLVNDTAGITRQRASR